MPRTRVISATQALFAAQNSTGSQATINQLHRIQNINYSSAINLTPVEQYGEQAPIDQVIVEAMTVSMDYSYLSTNVLNEANLGFVVDGSTQAVSGFLNHATDDRNYYLLTSPYGTDAVGGDTTAANNQVIGIGNGFINSYSFDAAVGRLPKVDIKVEGLNIVSFLNSSGQQSPAIIPSGGTRVVGQNFTLPSTVSGIAGQISTLRPGDLTFNIASLVYGVDVTDIKIQSVKIDVALAREPQQKLGSYFPFTREPRFPIPVNVSVQANAGDLISGDLSTLLCNNQDYNFTVTLNSPVCLGAVPKVVYTVNGAKLKNQSWGSQLNTNETVSLEFQALIGGVSDIIHSFKISGSLI